MIMPNILKSAMASLCRREDDTKSGRLQTIRYRRWYVTAKSGDIGNHLTEEGEGEGDYKEILLAVKIIPFGREGKELTREVGGWKGGAVFVADGWRGQEIGGL